ncbi:hypothetical protein [Phocaeicola abscessus]|uniref:hypothetical protein n=1 Tax=Phocaeicola abscessus TaxID=555313 RepID=UPI0028ED1CC8|nr:hypothetical protein [Phocaeicola abscessus]
MKKSLLLGLFIGATVLSSCTKEKGLYYGEKLKLKGTSWTCHDRAQLAFDNNGNNQISLPTADLTLSFNDNHLVLHGVERNGDKDTTYTLTGDYRYKHPDIITFNSDQGTLRLKAFFGKIAYDGGAFYPRRHEFTKD